MSVACDQGLSLFTVPTRGVYQIGVSKLAGLDPDIYSMLDMVVIEVRASDKGPSLEEELLSPNRI